MKRPLFLLLMVLTVAMGGALMAQYNETPATNDQQVDPSGEPETGPGPDVDVDVGENAEGAVDVDVTSQTDADTAATGVDETAGLTDTADDEALPATGSKTPLAGLIGLLALVGAVALRAAR